VAVELAGQWLWLCRLKIASQNLLIQKCLPRIRGLAGYHRLASGADFWFALRDE
jgi:hypothetical protein